MNTVCKIKIAVIALIFGIGASIAAPKSQTVSDKTAVEVSKDTVKLAKLGKSKVRTYESLREGMGYSIIHEDKVELDVYKKGSESNKPANDTKVVLRRINADGKIGKRYNQ